MFHGSLLGRRKTHLRQRAAHRNRSDPEGCKGGVQVSPVEPVIVLFLHDFLMLIWSKVQLPPWLKWLIKRAGSTIILEEDHGCTNRSGLRDQKADHSN